jgi:hypothetical protein
VHPGPAQFEGPPGQQIFKTDHTRTLGILADHQRALRLQITWEPIPRSPVGDWVISCRHLQLYKGRDAIRAADIPTTGPALDHRRERLLAAALATPDGTPKKLLLPPKASDASSRHRIPKWFAEDSARNWLVKDGRECAPRIRRRAP